MSKRRYAHNKATLAKCLGISYRTLVSHYWDRKDRPQNHSEGTSKYDIEAYRKWIETFKFAYNFGSRESNTVIYEPNEREKALTEKNKASAAREKFKLEIEMGEYIPRISANRDVDTANAIVIRELYKAMEHELPPRLEMLKAAEIRKVLVTKINQIIAYLPQQFLKARNGNGDRP